MLKIENAIASAIKYRNNGILITETFDVARSQAKKAIELGLQPFPIVVKDCFTFEGVRTTCASKMLESFVPSYTATPVQRLIDRGGCIIGKGNLDEFCMGTSSALGHFGPVKSGFPTASIEDDWFIPGGSSGGAAVAVQLGVAECGLGSDTGGSVRNPAAFTGVFGFKPTYGVLSRHGLIPLVNSLDVPAIFSQSAKSCWKYLEMMCGVDENDPTSVRLSKENETTSLQGLRIGIPKEYHNEGLSIEAWRVWNHAANILKKQGAEIVPVSLPHTKYSLICYHVMSTADIASNMARYDSVAYGHRSENESSTFDLYTTSRSESLNTVVRKRIFAGNYFLMKRHREQYFERALKVRRLISEEMIRTFDEVDLLLTPVASGPPPLFSQLHEGNFTREAEDDYYTQPANMAGVPAMSIPIGKCTSSGLPIAVQLIGNRLRDRFVIDASHLLYASSRTN